VRPADVKARRAGTARLTVCWLSGRRIFDDPTMIDGVTNSDAIPALERLLQFAGKRHRLITNNIANLSTPDFRPTDLSVDRFQETLGAAIDERRAERGNAGGDFGHATTRPSTLGALDDAFQPRSNGDNVLFHDGNDRNLESIMQDLVENYSVFRTAAELTRSRFELINTAIRERI
jgi:flagellar basal-body rod protein FlgB